MKKIRINKTIFWTIAIIFVIIGFFWWFPKCRQSDVVLPQGITIPTFSSSAVSMGDIQVKYETNNGLLGYYLNIKINNDGQVEIQERKNSNAKEKTRSYKLSSNELKNLKTLILESNIFELKNEYVCQVDRCPMDLSGESVKFTVDGKEKNIYIYAPTEPLPENLKKILDIFTIKN